MSNRQTPDQPDDRLTERELQVVDLLLCGRSAKEVAVELQLSHHTVRTHVRNVYVRLGLSTRLELMKWRLANSASEITEKRPLVIT